MDVYPSTQYSILRKMESKRRRQTKSMDRPGTYRLLCYILYTADWKPTRISRSTSWKPHCLFLCGRRIWERQPPRYYVTY